MNGPHIGENGIQRIVVLVALRPHRHLELHEGEQTWTKPVCPSREKRIVESRFLTLCKVQQSGIMELWRDIY